MDFNVEKLFIEKLSKEGNVYISSKESLIENQTQTNEVFSEKWDKYKKEEICEKKHKCKEVMKCKKCKAEFVMSKKFLKDQKRKIKDG